MAVCSKPPRTPRLGDRFRLGFGWVGKTLVRSRDAIAFGSTVQLENENDHTLAGADYRAVQHFFWGHSGSEDLLRRGQSLLHVMSQARFLSVITAADGALSESPSPARCCFGLLVFRLRLERQVDAEVRKLPVSKVAAVEEMLAPTAVELSFAASYPVVRSWRKWFYIHSSKSPRRSACRVSLSSQKFPVFVQSTLARQSIVFKSPQAEKAAEEQRTFLCTVHLNFCRLLHSCVGLLSLSSIYNQRVLLCVVCVCALSFSPHRVRDPLLSLSDSISRSSLCSPYD